ncbi:hypothetical protein QR98_0002700 [Sarcoptes scabiei]|uniref:Uncharacterized protein n=1 Tax=Sarcoptes scabiei TaxID=52283 RepID=A0A131ZTQ3_SARSC|nr:hypothetical protein QR98_0002700 [Sarcoptes scabiei]
MVTIDQGSKNKEIEIKNKMFESYELTNPRKEFFIIIANKIIHHVVGTSSSSTIQIQFEK